MKPTASAAETAGVTAEINYLAHDSLINRRYVAPGAEFNTGRYEPHRVRIRSGRALQSEFSLDRHGFELARHTSAVKNFRDRAVVEALYRIEVMDVIRELTGADFVVPLGWVLRTSAQTDSTVQPPASDVHVDMSHDRAHRLAKSLYDKAEPAGRGYSRFIATSLWRPFSAPPQDWPLAVCDGASVAPSEGVPNIMVVVDCLPDRDAIPERIENEESLPAASVFHFSANHRWWYFPDMTRDEVIVLKFHDSDHSKAWRVPHTAFHDESHPDAGPRESIEFRTVAFFR